MRVSSCRGVAWLLFCAMQEQSSGRSAQPVDGRTPFSRPPAGATEGEKDVQPISWEGGVQMGWGRCYGEAERERECVCVCVYVYVYLSVPSAHVAANLRSCDGSAGSPRWPSFRRAPVLLRLGSLADAG